MSLFKVTLRESDQVPCMYADYMILIPHSNGLKIFLIIIETEEINLKIFGHF